MSSEVRPPWTQNPALLPARGGPEAEPLTLVGLQTEGRGVSWPVKVPQLGSGSARITPGRPA